MENGCWMGWEEVYISNSAVGLYLTHLWLWAMQRAKTLCNGRAMDYRDSAM